MPFDFGHGGRPSHLLRLYDQLTAQNGTSIHRSVLSDTLLARLLMQCLVISLVVRLFCVEAFEGATFFIVAGDVSSWVLVNIGCRTLREVPIGFGYSTLRG